MKIHTLYAAISLTCVHIASHAIVNGFDPDVTPAVVPTTGVTTENWKFVGSSSGVSAVQVAPQWIVAARHAPPPVGATFSNKFGSTTIGSQCVFPTTTYVVGSETDLALCRLNTAIVPPSSVTFPAVVGIDRTSPFNVHAIGHWGRLLATGFSTGARRTTWANFAGLQPGLNPYDVTLNPTGRYLNMDTLSVPRTANGDSGGGVYFYPATGAAATGHLVGVLVTENTINYGTNYFTPAYAQWIVDTIAGHGDVAPSLVNISQLVGDPAARQARNMASGSVTAAVTGTSTASITFTEPPANAAFSPITNYLIKADGLNGATGTTSLVYAPGTYTIAGLTDGRQYQACVRTGNDKGYGAGITTLFSVKSIERPGCAFFIAGAPNPPQVFFGPAAQTVTNSSTPGYLNVTGQWSAPLPNGVTTSSYFVTLKVWPNWVVRSTTDPTRILTVHTYSTSFTLPNVTSGEEYACWSVAARSTTQTQGPASGERCFDYGSVPN